MKFEECLGFLLSSNEIPEIGSHFASNSTLSRRKVHSEKADQLVLNNLIKRTTKNNSKVFIPAEYHELFKLIPESSAADIGKEIPGNDFESLAVKVPKKLVETEVNWAEYGFYSSGN